MNLELSKDDLQRALGRVQNLIDRRNTMPLLTNVLLEATAEGLRVTASDNELLLVGEYPASISHPGSVCLPARQFNDIVRSLPASTLRLVEVGGHAVEVTSGNAYFRILGVSGAGFPGLPGIEESDRLELKVSDLQRLIEAILFSVSTDDTRYGLNGALLEADDDESGIRLVSTDGHRLSISRMPDIASGTLSRSYLLPRKGLQELRKVFDVDGDASVIVRLAEGAAMFECGRLTFSMRLLEGEFPDYRQVVPEHNQRRVTLSREEFTQALRRVSILSSEKTHSVRFGLEDDVLMLASANPEFGESREALSAEITGGNLAIGFNAKYFLDALSVIRSEKVTLHLGDSLHPALLRAEDSDAALYVIMPMRIE